MTDRIDRHHLLEIILWPNPDGTFREIRNSKARLKELGIYDDYKMCIEIPRDLHARLHNKGKKLSVETRDKLSKKLKLRTPTMLGKHHSMETRIKMSLSQRGEKNPRYGKIAKNRGKFASKFGMEFFRKYGKTYSDDPKLYRREQQKWYKNNSI